MIETRKELIELLEPYMDKTLSYGCLVNVDTRHKDLQIHSIMILKENWYWTAINELWQMCSFTQPEIRTKILWHYDITAVLKYIWKEVYTYTYTSLTLWDRLVIFKNFRDLDDNRDFIEIPNKSLYLYTEQQEEELLISLKQLWKQ